MNLSFMFFCYTVENIIMSMCIVRAACETKHWWLMFFLLLPFLNHPRVRFLDGDDDGKDTEE